MAVNTKNMKQVLVYQSGAKSSLVGNYFYSDLLAYKVNKSQKQDFNEVLLFSMSGYPTDVKKFLIKSNKIIINYKEEGSIVYDKFVIDPDNYDTTVIKGGEFQKIIFTRRVDPIISQSEEEDANKNYPILILTQNNRQLQKSNVYNMTKNGTTVPMFPNVEEPLILAGELSIDQEIANNVLQVLRGESEEVIDKNLLKRAMYLINTLNKWKDYLFNEMIRAKLIKEVQIKFSNNPIQVYEVVLEEKTIQEIIQRGVRNRDITFTESKSFKSDIDSFDKYMKIFSKAMRKRIYEIARPLHTADDFQESFLYWSSLLKRKALQGQLNPLQAGLKSIHEQNKVNYVGECGVGKTFLMTATNWIYCRQLQQTMKLLVFCPDTLTDSVWKDEIDETLYDCEVHVIDSVNDLIEYDKLGYLDDNQDRAFILSQRVGKSGYNMKPAVNWSIAKQAFTCPDCGSEVLQTVKNDSRDPRDPKYIDVPVPFNYFDSHRYANHECKQCEAKLWEVMNKDAFGSSKFVYSGELKGFYPKDSHPVKKHLEGLVKNANDARSAKAKAQANKEIEKHRFLQLIIEGKHKEGKRIAPKKVSVAEFIFKKMKNRFTNLIVDEFHEFQGSSQRTDACAQLINSVPVVVTGTGTAMNGYAKSRFKTDYMMYPAKMKKAGFKITDEEKYQVTFGVTEKRYRLRREKGKSKRQALTPKAKPGISPVIFPLFMQDTTVFVSLEDLKESLPALRHYQIEVEMDEELENAKKKLEADIKKSTRYDKKLFRQSIQVGYSFLDSPTKKKELRDKDTKEVIIETPTVSHSKDLKLQKLIESVKSEVETENRRVMVYTYYTGDGINEYIRENLANEGFKVTVLNKEGETSTACDGSTPKVKKEDREKFIKEEVKNGCEILVVNPELIKTGYNLTEFSTIIYYQMGYQVYTNRQADRRSWRLGQTRDCKIIYIYYKDSIQQDVASLMATKIVASQAIEGHMDAAGLEAIISDRTAEEELAQKFFEGIREKVELNNYNSGRIA